MLKRILSVCAAAMLLVGMCACHNDSQTPSDSTGTADLTETENSGTPGVLPKDAAVVRYSDFGAVGDGVTDDYSAIRKAHMTANARNLPVEAEEGKTYYLAPAFDPIVIQTDTDWTGASFIIDDSEINTEDHWARNVSVFSVEPGLARIDFSLDALSVGDTNIGYAPGVDCLVYLRCDAVRHYIRYGANADSGQAQTEILLVDAEGNIDPSTPLTWDYPSVDKCYAIPVDETPITIEGGSFVTVANEINPDKYISVARNINITRSNTTVKNVSHTIEQTKDYRAAYGGFFNITYCSNVTVENCEIMCHDDSYFTNDAGQQVLLGSYEFLGSYNNNVSYIGCVQTNLFDENGKLISSGLMGTNYCRNISMIDCTVARFDAHCQVYNVTIRGCTMERINAIGFGTLLVENTTIHDRYIINLREDYGSMFAGDVILRNVSMVREDTQRLSLFNGAWYNHNFGYPLYLPQTVTIENLTVPDGAYVTPFVSAFDNYENVTLDTLSDGSENENPLIVPQSITVLSNPAGTRFRNSRSAIPFPEITGETGDEAGGAVQDMIFSLSFEQELRTTDEGFVTTISDIARDAGVGSAVLYDGNEVHSDMNIKHIAVDGDETNRALLWTGCGNPNEASKQANITIDVKPASGAQNLDAFVYDDYHGRDFVVSFDIRAVEHEPYSAVTTDLFRMTSFYTPNGADGKTVTYSECLLQMDGNTYKLSVPNAGGRKRPTLDAVVPADRFMNLAVHVHPAENTYDLYIDGVCAAEDIVFLSVSSKKLVGTYDETGAMVLSDKENPTEDFCLSYARLCNTNGWMIAGDLFYLDNVVMYFADEFSVK